jgi:hypothetical protein
MSYPGRIVKVAEKDGAVVRAIADRLIARGIAISSVPGVFDAGFASAVRLFQTLNLDLTGKPLVVDGEVGPMTWGALFGPASVPVAATAGSALARKALAIAEGEKGNLEIPLGSNAGIHVEKYLASTDLPGGYFWCMAFVHWCFKAAADQLGVPNSFPKTAGVLDAWNKSSSMRVRKTAALADLSLVGPGSVFILDYGTGYGHTGFVVSNLGGSLVTVEGNTDPAGSGNGIGVFELNKRNVANSLMKGFINVP